MSAAKTGQVSPRKPAPQQQAPWRLGLGLILIVTFGAYFASLDNGYTYDDSEYVQAPSKRGQANHLVAEWQGLPEYFKHYYGHGSAETGRGFRPITVISFALVQKAFEEQPPNSPMKVCSAEPHHWVNLLFHMGAVVVLFFLLASFVGRSWAALAGAAVFALHALRSDPVIQIVSRSELMSFVFGGCALLLYMRGLRGGSRRWWCWAGTAVLVFLSLGSKESATPWIIFMPLYVIALGFQDASWRELGAWRKQLVPWLVSALLPTIMFGLIYYLAVRDIWADFEVPITSNPLRDEPGLVRAMSGVHMLAYGLWKLIYPFDLAADYGPFVFTPIRGFGDYRFWLAFAALAACLGLGLRHARRHPLLFLAVALFFGFTFMVSNIPLLVETIFGERLYYTPATAMSFLVAWLATRKFGDRTLQVRQVLAAAAGLWLIACGVKIYFRCHDWESNVTLFPADAAHQPKSMAMQMAAGRQFRLKAQGMDGTPQERMQHRMTWKGYLDKALELGPESPLPLNDSASWNLEFANILRSMGRQAEGEIYLKKAQELILRGFKGKHFELKRDGRTLNQMQGDIHQWYGNMPEAIRWWRKSAAANPEAPDARMKVIGAFMNMNKMDLARQEMLASLKEAPRQNPIRLMLFRDARRRKDGATMRRLLKEIEGKPMERFFATAMEGWFAYDTGNLERALMLFDRLPKAGGGEMFAEELVTLATGLQRIGVLDGAQRVLGSVIQNAAQPPFWRQKAAELLRAMRGGSPNRKGQ